MEILFTSFFLGYVVALLISICWDKTTWLSMLLIWAVAAAAVLTASITEEGTLVHSIAAYSYLLMLLVGALWNVGVFIRSILRKSEG